MVLTYTKTYIHKSTHRRIQATLYDLVLYLLYPFPFNVYTVQATIWERYNSYAVNPMTIGDTWCM